MAGSSVKKKSTGSNTNTKTKTTAKSNTKKKTSEKAAEQDTSFLQSEVAVLGAFAVCVFLFLSNFHICGVVGDVVSSVMLGVFGSIGYIAPVLLFAGMIFYASNIGNIRAVYKMLAVEVLLLVLCGLAQQTIGGGYQEGQTLREIYGLAGESGLGGGIIGGAIVLVLHRAVGTIGTYLVLLVFLIVSIVCITEKSFVSAVKKGGGKAYQFAKEDYGRRKEIREEKRLLREEQRVQGVNLNSTDLSRNGTDTRVSDIRFRPADAPTQEADDVLSGRQAAAGQAVTGQAATEQAVTGQAASGQAASGQAASEAPAVGQAGKRPDPADVFKGRITMGGADPEEDVVPFEEDVPLSARRRDEDVFVRRDSAAIEAMGLFPDRKAQEASRPETRPASRTEEPQPVPAPEIWSGSPSETLPVRRTEEPQPVPAPEIWPGSPSEVSPVRRTEELPPRQPEAEPSARPELQPGPGPEIRPGSPSESPQAARPEVFRSPEERKRVVTSTGKVIETDAEEIVKQKAEKRKMDAAEREAAGQTVLQEIQKTEQKPKKPYIIPPLDLLSRGKKPAFGQSDKEFKETAIKLQQTLRNFGVGVTVTNISCGPTVTRYELHPEQGVKVSRIQSLADDIKLNLAATDIRIEAPIPGKAAVGIEVPNKVNSIVYLRELLESDEFKKHPSRLAFAVGKDIGGQPIVADLAKMPHLLIAGQTGSGKSVGINTMIMSLIYRASPEDVKLIMIDPKVVELSVYNGIPHLLIPVVTDPKKAAGALNWAVAEMMERYNKFASSNVRDIKGYNARVKSLEDSGAVPPEEIPAKLPQLVIIIDELADLMMVASGEVEDAICRLAQLARAAGIHLVIATQRPSVNVITGVIKANVPSRIAFSVASGVDSRTILDMNGAEKLLGNGDMLFYPSGYPKPIRVQGAFVSDSEVSRVTDFIREQNDYSGYSSDLEKQVCQTPQAGANGGGNDRDALFADAGKFIIEKDKASIGMLQRMFKIGFNRAARIMDQLAEAGVVGEEEGTKPRKILMSMEEFEERLEQGF